MPKRRKLNQDAVATLQFRADLRCCLCQYVGDLPPRPKSGQIHHIDGDPSNGAIENLVWLCLEHHEEVGKIGRSSRRIHAKTLIRFRDELERRIQRQRRASRDRRQPGRRWFSAALDAGIVLDVHRRRMDTPGEWDDIDSEVTKLGSYPDEMGHRARQAILERLDTIAAGARFRMPHSVTAGISRVTIDLLPLSFLYAGRRRRPSSADIDLLVLAATIGESLAYDGALKLGNLRIAEEGCDILWRVMSFAVIHKHRRLKEAVTHAFKTALDGATRSGIPGAVDLVNLTQAHGEAAGTRIPEYPDSLALLL